MGVTGTASRGRAQGRRRGPRFGVALIAGVALAGACRPLRYGGGGGAGGGGGSTVDTDCQPLTAVARRIWRLSLPQYSNSVRDLLGLPIGPAIEGGPNANGGQTFLVDDSLSLDPALALQMDSATHAILTDGTADVVSLAACQAGEGEEACARRFAQTFGRRAFRRPLGDDEVADLLVVYADGRQQDFTTGIGLMIEALLISPSFLFRTELGASPSGATTLTPYEVASQLSYTLVDSTPDGPLLDAAASGALATDGGIVTQVDRLLATDAGRRNVDRVVANWLHGGSLGLQAKDPALLFDVGGVNANQSLIEGDLFRSLVAFVDDAVWGGGRKVTDLLSSSILYGTQRLARLYGLPFFDSNPDALTPLLAPNHPSGGVLMQPAFLWAITDGDGSPIVRRGVALRDAVVCGEPIADSADLHQSPAVVDALALLPTDVQRSDYAVATEPCRGCHARLDPFGRVLQGFDAVGRVRVTADGSTIVASGDFSALPPLSGTITGAAALEQAVTADGQFAGCAVEKMASYAVGRALQGDQTCETRRLTAAFTGAGSDGTIGTLLRQVALAPFVRARGGASP
jgi:hypothetical protein